MIGFVLLGILNLSHTIVGSFIVYDNASLGYSCENILIYCIIGICYTGITANIEFIYMILNSLLYSDFLKFKNYLKMALQLFHYIFTIILTIWGTIIHISFNQNFTCIENPNIYILFEVTFWYSTIFLVLLYGFSCYIFWTKIF